MSGQAKDAAAGRSLSDLLDASAARFPGRPAVFDPAAGGEVSYAELAARAEALAAALAAAGVGAGDRVGLCLPKSIDSVAGVFAILKLGAAYVPVDAGAPAERNAFIFDDCGVAAVVGPGGEVEARAPSPRVPSPEGLAYILYTSGSTGQPKGVMLTHANALSFVDWCSETFSPTEGDRFSSHAPFHFDLSVLDLYVPVKHGAAIVLIGEALGKNARELAPVIADYGITMWYSTPTVLRLLTEFGALGEHDLSKLRVVNFAGEVFPVKHLRALRELLPGRRFFNLYGPTETNVCTAHEIPAEIPAGREKPYPIGAPCSNVEARIEEGELLIAGGPVMLGYWNLPERTGAAFLEADGKRWYRTGDVVEDLGGGVLDYVGRRDRMVKRRGFRVELGEVEAGLYKHPAVVEAAAVAVPDPDSGVHIRAFVVTGEDAGGKRPNVVTMKLFCNKAMLGYMVPDSFAFLDALPKTSTDKTDYQTLAAIARGD